MERINTNATIWDIHDCVHEFSGTLRKDYQGNLRATKNAEFSETRLLLYITQKMILDQEDEICGVSTVDWDTTPWMRSTLLHEHAIKLSTATKVYVFSDSVLCL